MKVIYIRDSKSRGYLRIGFSDGEQKIEYTVSEFDYKELGSLLIGDTLEEPSGFILADMRYRARLCALRLLSYGDNNESSLMRKLISRSISPEVAREVCEEMVSRGYINERRQLERLIETEANVRLNGRKRIFPRLIAKGYKREEIGEVLESLVDDGVIDFSLIKKRLLDKYADKYQGEEKRRELLYKHGFYSDL